MVYSSIAMIKQEKPRYIKFEIISKKEVEFEPLKRSILKTALSFLGENDFRNANILILEDMWKNKKGVIKTSHKYVNKVKVILALIRKIDNTDIIIKSSKVSGTLKKIGG